MEYKQVILIRADLKMSKGKTAVQASHASVQASLKAKKKFPKTLSSWKRAGMKKVALKVSSKKELYEYIQQAKDAGLITATISDAGMTELAPGTVTAGAIGPNREDKIDQITSNLKTL